MENEVRLLLTFFVATLLTSSIAAQGVFLRQKQTSLFTQFSYADVEDNGNVSANLGCAIPLGLDIGVGVGRVSSADKGTTYLTEQASVYLVRRYKFPMPFSRSRDSSAIPYIPISISVDQGYSAVFGTGTSGDSYATIGGTVNSHLDFSETSGLVISASFSRFLRDDYGDAPKHARGIHLAYSGMNSGNVFAVTISHVIAKDMKCFGVTLGLNFIQGKKRSDNRSDWDD